MGMFDSLYDANGIEWQTKAFSRTLTNYRIGDPLPSVPISSYQMKVIGGPHDEPYLWSYATIRNRKLATVPDERDKKLPLLDYSGGWLEIPEGT